MKALSLWQPWATLIAIGAKQWETRGWRTAYRGPLAICSTVNLPGVLGLRSSGESWSEIEFGCYRVRQVVYRGRGGRRLRTDTMLFDLCNEQRWPLPLGVVLAVAELVDCCPIGGTHSFSTGLVEGETPETAGQDVIVNHGHLVDEGHGRLVLDRWQGPSDVLDDQLPFGDWGDGRYGWRLENVRPVDPVPVKGRQGLWNLPEEIEREVLAA